MKNSLRKVKKNVNPELLKETNHALSKRFDGKEEDIPDPSLFCTSFNKRRFYIFTRNEHDGSDGEPRDIINEKEVIEDDILQEEDAGPTALLAKRIALRTNAGDIEVELWADIAPKA